MLGNQANKVLSAAMIQPVYTIGTFPQNPKIKIFSPWRIFQDLKLRSQKGSADSAKNFPQVPEQFRKHN
jgi:hypothetical protein